MKTITKNIALFIITLGIVSSPFSAHAATWVGPTATPPGNNVSAPVNVGGTYQIKTGDLGVFSFFANYIRSLGTISANRYCFNSGASNGRDTNCITSWPTGGTGTGIESIVAGTNVTVDNTDPLNPVVSSTATGGTSGVVVRKDGVPVVAPATTLNFTGSNITTTPSGNSVSIAVAPANPTAVQKDGIQVSAAPLAINFRGDNITTLNTNGVVSVDVKNLAIQKNGVVVSSNPPTLNFTGNNFTTFTNVDGTVNLDIKTKISAVNEGAVIGTDFNTIDVGAGGLLATNAGNGVLMLGFDPTALGSVLPSPSPADKILRSNGTAWVQSPLVKHTASSFQVNRPIADNSTENIFHAAKMYNVFGNPVPLIGLFVTKDGDTYVNGAKFRHSGIAGTTATPTNSFGTDDIFQSSINSAPNQKGLAVRADGGVRVRGELSALNNAVVPLSTGLFLGANDIFHVVGELNGAKKGFGLAVDGTTRVEGILAVNGGQALIGDMIHMGNTTQTGNVNQTGNTTQVGNTTQTGNYTMQGPSATMTLGNTTNSAQLNITGNMTQTGNYNQVGNYSVTGNITQTGNINTQGRWAMNDSNPPAYIFSWSDPLGFSIPYSFLASVGNNGSLGSIGINRAGQTRINGTMVVNGPANVIGNLAVSGTIKSGSLANSGIIDLHVCADQTGTLKICDVPLPEVEILNTSLPSNQFNLTYNGNSTSGFPTPSVSTNVTYRVKNSTSCSASTEVGTTSGWNAPVVGAGSNDPAWDQLTIYSVNIQSFGMTRLKITCQNAIGNQATSTLAVIGKGTLYYMTPGTYSFTLPSSILGSAKAYVWGGGGGGGGSYWGNYSQNACGAGGAGGAGEYEIVNVIPNAGPAVAVVGGGASGGNGFSDSGNNPTGQAGSGQNGGTSTFSVNGNNMATATGGYGGQGGGQSNGSEYGGSAGWSGGHPGAAGGSGNTGQCSAIGGLIGGMPFTTGWISGNTNIAYGGAGASVVSGTTAAGAAGQKGGFILSW